MPSLCFYFQVHQPYRLRHYTFFDMGISHYYEDVDANSTILHKVANKCYMPMNALLLKLIRRFEGRFKVSFSITSVALTQFQEYAPEVIDSFKALVDTGCAEILSETSPHSLAALFSKEEFKAQVQEHDALMHEVFGVTPTVFRNTELIYRNDIAEAVEEMGYKAIITEGADRILGWRSPNYVYQPSPCTKMKLLLKNYKLSDDIAFRFSNRAWDEWPLTAPKYASWVHAINGSGEVINLFMDYETFGEHQWADSGIFDFMDALPAEILKNPDFDFVTPSEEAERYEPVSKLDVPNAISWADAERDLTAWMGNDMQDDAFQNVYSLEAEVKELDDPAMTRTWRRLQTSDHFYYMCTKWFSDGDVHAYFNAYGSPYDAYINYMNVLADFRDTLDQKLKEKRAVAPTPAPAAAPAAPAKSEKATEKAAKPVRRARTLKAAVKPAAKTTTARKKATVKLSGKKTTSRRKADA